MARFFLEVLASRRRSSSTLVTLLILFDNCVVDGVGLVLQHVGVLNEVVIVLVLVLQQFVLHYSSDRPF